MTLDTKRRLILLIVISLFVLQCFGLKVLVGSLSGSLLLWYVSLIDIYAFLETLVACKSIEFTAVYAFLPIFIVYLTIGRAFCGWVCPMDFLFELVSVFKKKIKAVSTTIDSSKTKILKTTGYAFAVSILVISAVLEIPVFTNYLSHLTNFFRTLNSLLFAVLGTPFTTSILLYSFAGLVVLFALEYVSPRLWCKYLCPLGKIYGLLNYKSLLRISVAKDTCIKCENCDNVCYMGIKISKHTDKNEIRDADCIFCGRCVKVCKNKANTLSLTFRRQ